MIKRMLLILMSAWFLGACSTTDLPKYNPKEFETANYQKNVDNAVDAADLLSDFDQSKVPASQLETSDMSSLVQADLYYNQGNYAQAYPLYNSIAYKYKDPRIVYKTIICLEHVSSTPAQAEALNGLINLFIQVDPDSNIAKLFQIKQSLNADNTQLAEDDLNALINKNPGKGRVIFLFLSSIISNDLTPDASSSLSRFATYVTDTYTAYPEAHLSAILAYSVADDQSNLAKQIDVVQKNYPNWYVPLYWSSDILTRHKHVDTLIQIFKPLVTVVNPDKVLQNIYVAALMNENKIADANAYLLTQINSINRDNVLIDLGILAVKDGKLNDALNYFNQAKTTDKTMFDITALVKAAIYDSQNQTNLAINNYKAIVNTQYLVAIADVMLLNAYLEQNNIAGVDEVLNRLAREAKMNEEQTLLFKSGYYMSEEKFQLGYNLLQDKLPLYIKDQDYLYQYAALTSMLNKTNPAIKLYKEYIKKYPTVAYGYNDLAYVYAEQTHDYKLAIKYAEEASKLAPTDPNVMDTLGWAYYKSGQYAKALPYLKTSYEANYNPESAKHLIAVYTALKQPDLVKTVIVMDKHTLQKQLKDQLVHRSLALLMYIQFGIENKQ